MVEATARRTERLILRPYELTDADDYAALQGNQEVVRYMYWPLRTPEESLEHLKKRIHCTTIEKVGDFLAFAVWSIGHERVIGDVSFHLRRESPDAAVEVAWLFHPDFQGRGYAYEAASEMLRFIREELGARPYAKIFVNNHASARLAERLNVPYSFEERNAKA